jgi:YD repeat-containing protein
LGRCAALACLAVIGTVHAASNVVQYTHDAAGNIIAIGRANPVPITITGFAPPSGPTGTLIAITGTGFGATASDNVVTFNGVSATVVAAAVTALTVAVPAGATTGKIAVTVGGSIATSAQEFVVIAPGVPTIAGFTPAAGPPGTAVTVTGTNFNAAPGATTVKLNQNGATASSVVATKLAFAVPAATGSGRISIATAAGSVISAADFVVPPASIAAADILLTTRLAANGPEQSLGLFAGGKYGVVLFDGSTGDWLSLQFRNFAVNPAGATIWYAIHKPDNSRLASGTLSAASLSIHLPPLPVAGTYTLLLGTGIAQVSLDARLERNEFVPTAGTTLSVARSVGQSTRLLLAAVAGDQKALMVSGLNTVPAGGRLDYTISLPSGSTFRMGTASELGSTTQLPPFTVTGTHTVVYTPRATTTQTAFKVGLLAGVALPVDGGAVDLAIGSPGEGARLSFAGVAGQNLGLGITGLVLSPATATYASIAVYRPNADFLTSALCRLDGTQCAVNMPNLPVTGTYNIIVHPESGATGSLRAWLSRDAAGTLASGTPYRLTLARPGQNARLEFAGTAGALIALQVRGIETSPTAQRLYIAILKPDGWLPTFAYSTGAGQILIAPPLPVTGKYTVFIEPDSAAKGAATASMEVLLDPGQSLAIDGPTSDAVIGLPGGSARFTFAGTAGQNLGLGVSNLALNPKVDATVYVYRPDGAQLTAYTCAASAGGCGSNISVQSTGTFGIVVTPFSNATGGFGVTLSSDFGGSLVVGGPALQVPLDRPGRNARLSFAGTAGQTLRLIWSAAAISGLSGRATAYVSTPSGSALGTASIFNGSAGSYDIPALPATGNYTLFIDPAAGATLNTMLTLVAR